jgi:hypothetical protein
MVTGRKPPLPEIVGSDTAGAVMRASASPGELLMNRNRPINVDPRSARAAASSCG